MKKTVLTKVTWMLNDRIKEIPRSIKYSTVACFKDIENKYPKEAWSVVIDTENGKITGNTITCEIRFLVADAPQELLYHGSEFKLFDGKNCIATGVII